MHRFFAVDHPLYDVWNEKKNQILIEFLDGTKEVQLAAKKSSARVQSISHRFFAVDHPLYDFWKEKKNQILIEFLDGTKKVQLAAKKSSARV